MNCSEFKHIIQNPESIDAVRTQQLEDVITEFPYFQSARAIQLKGLNKINSYKYNPTLKKTAAYTIDRKVLFDFITSPVFINKTIKEVELLEDIEIIDAETIQVLHKKITETVSTKSTTIEPTIIKEIETEETSQKGTEILEIGKPIQFSSTEPHSFNEWMQLISQKPISRQENTENNVKKHSDTEEKFNLIDKFIESNPKIKPVDKNAKNIDFTIEGSTENESIMTETLAKVYLEQKKYENAIKAYRILCLKYPEKSGFFADRIKAIKILQRN